MIYCYGVTALSRILRLQMDFPKPNGYAEVGESADNIGGEAVGTAMCLDKPGESSFGKKKWEGSPGSQESLIRWVQGL